MVRRGEMMSTEDVLDILAVNLLGAVPDEESVVIAANHGESLIGSNTLAGQAFLNIARRLDGRPYRFWTCRHLRPCSRKSLPYSKAGKVSKANPQLIATRNESNGIA